MNMEHFKKEEDIVSKAVLDLIGTEREYLRKKNEYNTKIAEYIAGSLPDDETEYKIAKCEAYARYSDLRNDVIDCRCQMDLGSRFLENKDAYVKSVQNTDGLLYDMLSDDSSETNKEEMMQLLESILKG